MTEGPAAAGNDDRLYILRQAQDKEARAGGYFDVPGRPLVVEYSKCRASPG